MGQEPAEPHHPARRGPHHPDVTVEELKPPDDLADDAAARLQRTARSLIRGRHDAARGRRRQHPDRPGPVPRRELDDHWRLTTERAAHGRRARRRARRACSRGAAWPTSSTASALSTTVPTLTHRVDERRCARICGAEPIVIGPGVRTGMPVRTDNPREVGPDRIANSVAAHAHHGGPCIVVDFGTSTNFDVVSADGRVPRRRDRAGRRDLDGRALQPRRPPRQGRPGDAGHARSASRRSASMQSGAVFGFAGQVDGLVRRIQAELGGPCPVVATGGLAGLLAAALRDDHDARAVADAGRACSSSGSATSPSSGTIGGHADRPRRRAARPRTRPSRSPTSSWRRRPPARCSSATARAASATPTCTSSTASWSASFPLVLGHEGAGVVEAVGEGVTNVAVGRPRRAVVVVPVRHVPAVPARRAVGLLRQPRDRQHAARRHHAAQLAPTAPVGQYLSIGTFATHAVVPAVAAVRDPARAAVRRRLPDRLRRRHRRRRRRQHGRRRAPARPSP